jgi:hypothetical protein
MRFVPKRIDDIKPAALPWVGKVVTVRSWHQDYKNPEKSVGFIDEFGLDIPEDELEEE